MRDVLRILSGEQWADIQVERELRLIGPSMQRRSRVRKPSQNLPVHNHETIGFLPPIRVR
jgi:hypothetical protein